MQEARTDPDDRPPRRDPRGKIKVRSALATVWTSTAATAVPADLPSAVTTDHILEPWVEQQRGATRIAIGRAADVVPVLVDEIALQHTIEKPGSPPPLSRRGQRRYWSGASNGDSSPKRKPLAVVLRL